MGDAFVGPWDIANLASDFLMGKMGAEVSGCSTEAPSSSSAGGDASTSSSMFRLTRAGVDRVQGNLASDFSRYRFLKDFMNEDLDWEDVNIVMAVYQGYLPEDGVAATDEGVRHVWRRIFPGPMPPDIRTAEGVIEALEMDYPDLPDVAEGLQVIVETLYGGEATKVRFVYFSHGLGLRPEYVEVADLIYYRNILCLGDNTTTRPCGSIARGEWNEKWGLQDNISGSLASEVSFTHFHPLLAQHTSSRLRRVSMRCISHIMP